MSARIAFTEQTMPGWKRAVLKVGSSLLAGDGGLSPRNAQHLAAFVEACQAQGREVQGVVAEQPADAEEPDSPGLAQSPDSRRSHDPAGAADEPPDREGHRGELERRHRARQRRQQGKERPEQDRAEAEQGRTGHVGRREGGAGEAPVP